MKQLVYRGDFTKPQFVYADETQFSIVDLIYMGKELQDSLPTYDVQLIDTENWNDILDFAFGDIQDYLSIYE